MGGEAYGVTGDLPVGGKVEGANGIVKAVAASGFREVTSGEGWNVP